MALSTNKTILLIVGMFTIIGTAGGYYGYTEMRQITSIKYQTAAIDRGELRQWATVSGTLNQAATTDGGAQDANDASAGKLQLEVTVKADSDVTPDEGQNVDISVDEFPKKTFAAVVKQSYRLANTTQNPSDFKILLDVDNSEMLLKPGTTAKLRLTTDRRPDVLRLPKAALSYKLPEKLRPLMEEAAKEAAKESTSNDGNESADGGRTAIVYILSRENMPLPIKVKVGISNDQYSEILASKLSKGHKVIVGHQAVHDNSGKE